MMKKLAYAQLLARQQELMGRPRVPLTVILDNVRSLHNVGSIFRTCDGIGAEKLWLCGITAAPPHGGLTKTALGAEDRVPWEYSPDLVPVIKKLKASGHAIVALEQTDESRLYQDYRPAGPVCLIVGNEIQGVADEAVALCDASLEIGMFGVKNSLNVSVAFGIVAYHLGNHLAKIN